MEAKLTTSPFRSLEALQEQARRSSFGIEDINWTKTVDRTKPWAPSALAPWSYLESFKSLRPEIQLRYNQLFALATAELFIWFESDLVCRVLGSILQDRQLSPLFVSNIETFIAEELKHSEMFWMLLQKSEPAIYKTRRPAFFVSSWARVLSEKLLVAAPKTSLAWIWAAIMMEERTLSYSKHYFELRGTIDDLFVDIHYQHMKDEVRHVQMDVHFLKEIYDKAPMWKRKVASWMLNSFVKSYLTPVKVSVRIAEQLKREFREFDDSTAAGILEESRKLRFSIDFQKERLGSQAMPRFRSLLVQYPEMRRTHDLLCQVSGEHIA